MFLAILLFVSMMPIAAFAADQHTISYTLGEGVDGTAPAAQEDVQIGSRVTLASADGITREGYSFSGWTVSAAPDDTELVGTTYSAGVTITMPDSDITLTPAWGQVAVELEVGEAAPPALQGGNYLMTGAGGASEAVFDFTDVLPDVTITSIRFDDQGVDGEPVSGSDPYEIDISEQISAALYARQVGYVDAAAGYNCNVVAYVQPTGNEQYELVITAEGGVHALETQYLFAAMSQTASGATIITDGSGWNGSITTVDVTHLDTSGVQYFSGMFAGMTSLTAIVGIDSLDTSSAVRMPQMFLGCSNLTGMDLTDWEMSNVTLTDFMFNGDVSQTDFSWIQGWDVSSLESGVGMFQGSGIAGTLDLTDWQTDNLTTIAQMFLNCVNLENVDMSGWNLPRLTNAAWLFAQANSTTTNALRTVDMDGWNAPELTTIAQMLQYSDVTSVSMENWNVPALEDMSYAFNLCDNLTGELDLSGWTTGSVNNMNRTFNQCSSLESLNLDGLIHSYAGMTFGLTFSNMDALTYLNISEWTIDGASQSNSNLNLFFQGGSTPYSNVFGGPSNWYALNIVADGWNFTADFPDGLSTTYLRTPLNDSMWTSNMVPESSRPGNLGRRTISTDNWNFNNHVVDFTGLLTAVGHITYGGSDSVGVGWTGLGGVNSVASVFNKNNNVTTIQTLVLQGLNIDNITDFDNMFQMFNTAEGLTNIDFSGWTGNTDNVDRLSSMFSRLNRDFEPGLTLTVTNDDIGNAIATAFRSRMSTLTEGEDYTITMVDPVPGGSEGGSGSEGGTGGSESGGDGSETGSEGSTGGNSGETGVGGTTPGASPDEGDGGETVDTDEPTDPTTPDASETAYDYTESEDGALRTQVEPSAQGDQYDIKATVLYTGDTGISGPITLTVTLPENMAPADGDATSVAVAAFTDADGNRVATGTVENAVVSGNTLTVTLNHMVAGTQVEISFPATLTGDGVLNAEGTQYTWDVLGAVATEDNVSSDQMTYRFWRNAESTEEPEEPVTPPGGGGGGTTPTPTPEPDPEPEEPDTPGIADPDDTGVSDWLNTEDHISYLNGYPDGTFGPSRNMTRAEVAAMFSNLLLDQDVDITTTFSDVAADAWYAEAVNKLASLGMIRGYEDGTFRPDQTITRAEFTAIAMRFTNGATGGNNIFSDVEEGAWYYDTIVGSIQYGWIAGYEDGTFRPNNTITRAEVTAITNRMLGRTGDADYIDTNADDLRQFPDVTNGHWAYYSIMEATNAHDYTKTDGDESWTAHNA